MKKENFGIITCVTLGFLCSVGGLASINAAAETTPEMAETAVETVAETTVRYADVQADVETCYTALTMDNGAAVRIKKDETGSYLGSGIKFSATVSLTEEQITEWTSAGVKFGVLIVPKDKLKTTASDGTVSYADVDENWLEHSSAFNCVGAPTAKGSSYEMQGILTDLKVNHYVRDYVGRAYIATPVESAEGTVTYEYHFAKYYNDDVANNTRSIYYVTQLAQEADATSTDAVDSKALYMDSAESQAYYGAKKYKYYIDCHYVNGNEETVVTEVAGGSLNESVTFGSYGETREYEGNTYEFDANRTDNTGTVYPSGRTRLKAYYYVKSAEVEDKSLAGILNRSDASEAFFSNTLHVNTDQTTGEITLTTDDGKDNNWDAKSAVMLTAEFLYNLQQAGYTKITIGELSSSMIANVSKLVLSGYYSATFTSEDGVNNGIQNLEISLAEKITYDASANKYYYEGTTTEVQDISITAYKNVFGYETTGFGSNWTLTDIRLE